MTGQPDSTADLEADLLEATATIRRHWPDLLDTPVGARSGSASADTLTALERRISLRQDVTRRLAAWCQVIIRDRGITHTRPPAEGVTTEHLLDVIDRHASWFADHVDAKRAAKQLARLARQVELTAEPPQRDYVRLGWCPFVLVDPDDPAELWECRGEVRAPIGADWAASCTGCGQWADIEWWQDVLELTVPLCTLPQLVPVLHRRLGLRVTDRTLRNWRRDGIIRPALVAAEHVPFGAEGHEPPGGVGPLLPDGLGPRLEWDLYDPQQVTADVIDATAVCRLCGNPWDGGGDVCRACYAATARAPLKLAEPRPAYPVVYLPRQVQPQTVQDVRDDDRPERCHYSDLPTDQCACGRHERKP